MDEARSIQPRVRWHHFILGDPQALQVVEFMVLTLKKRHNCKRVRADVMKNEGIGYRLAYLFRILKKLKTFGKPRKLGLGLFSNVKGPTKGRDFTKTHLSQFLTWRDYIEKVEQLVKAKALIERVSTRMPRSELSMCPAVNVHDPNEVLKWNALPSKPSNGRWSNVEVLVVMNMAMVTIARCSSCRRCLEIDSIKRSAISKES